MAAVAFREDRLDPFSEIAGLCSIFSARSNTDPLMSSSYLTISTSATS